MLAAVLAAVLPLGSEAFFGGRRRAAPPKEEVEEIDLYELLGVDEDASAKEIKTAFRKQSMTCHPDRTGGDEEAAEKFRTINFAYEILSSEEKKFLYDQGGMALLKEAEQQERQGGGGGGMDSFFGGFFGGGQRGNSGKDYRLRFRVSLEELYNGAEKTARISRRVVCRGCDKETSKQSERTRERCAKCGRCPNEVRLVQRQMGGFLVQQQEEVPSKHKCKNEPKELEALLERGMHDGQEIRFKYMSEQTPGHIPGDVVLVIQQAQHSKFDRDGDHLNMKLLISLKEALTGFSRTIQHLDGHEVTLDRENRITRPFETIVLQGEGMPMHEVPSQFGDLRVQIEVKFPSALSKEQIEQLKGIL